VSDHVTVDSTVITPSDAEAVAAVPAGSVSVICEGPELTSPWFSTVIVNVTVPSGLIVVADGTLANAKS
jgi:hypothetical protein